MKKRSLLSDTELRLDLPQMLLWWPTWWKGQGYRWHVLQAPMWRHTEHCSMTEPSKTEGKKDEKGKKKNARQFMFRQDTLFWRVSNAAGVALVNMCSHAIQARASFQTFQAWVSAHLNAGGKTREVVWLQEWSSPSFHLVLEHIFYVFEHKWCVLARQRSSPERTCAVATGLGGVVTDCLNANMVGWTGNDSMYFLILIQIILDQG